MVDSKYVKKIGNIKVAGEDVEVLLMSPPYSKPWYTMYANIPGASKFYAQNSPTNITFQKGDKIGIDTAHGYNEDQTLNQKYKDGIIQIREAIPIIKSIAKIANKPAALDIKQGSVVPLGRLNYGNFSEAQKAQEIVNKGYSKGSSNGGFGSKPLLVPIYDSKLYPNTKFHTAFFHKGGKIKRLTNKKVKGHGPGWHEERLNHSKASVKGKMKKWRHHNAKT
jgi:hypothetical protein